MRTYGDSRPAGRPRAGWDVGKNVSVGDKPPHVEEIVQVLEATVRYGIDLYTGAASADAPPPPEHTAGGVPEPEAEPTIFGPRHSCEEAAKLTCKILLACFADEGLSRLSRDRDAMRAQLSARKAQVGTERCALRPAFVLAIEEHLTRSQEAVAPRIRGKSETMMAPVFRRALDQLHVRLSQAHESQALRGAHQEAKEVIAVCRSEAYAPIQAYADMMAVLNGGGIEAVEADLEVRIDASDGRAYPLRSFPDVCVQPAVASLRRRTVT